MAVKRLIDITGSLSGLLLLSPLLLLIAIWVKTDSEGPILYRAKRVGQGGEHFDVLKFRTMVVNADNLGPKLTVQEDPRITNVGRVLRRTKIDELPQLINVLRGEMSLVGPRPEDPKYVEHFADDYNLILRVKPGLTSPASILYRDEQSLLDIAEPESLYLQQILPQKIKLDLDYVQGHNVSGDLRVIVQTLFRIFGI